MAILHRLRRRQPAAESTEHLVRRRVCGAVLEVISDLGPGAADMWLAAVTRAADTAGLDAYWPADPDDRQELVRSSPGADLVHWLEGGWVTGPEPPHDRDGNPVVLPEHVKRYLILMFAQPGEFWWM
ncbi:hypothetical protein [Mycolicibacter sinensis]